MDYLITAWVEAWQLILRADRQILEIAWVSLRLAFWSALVASCLAIPMGISVGQQDFKYKKLVLAVLQTLLALPTVVIGLLVYTLISRRGPAGHFGLLFSPMGVVIGQAILAFPIICTMVVNVFISLDKRAFQTAVHLGANRRQTMLILLRETRLGILAAVLTGFGRVFGEVGIAMMLGGEYQGLYQDSNHRYCPGDQ